MKITSDSPLLTFSSQAERLVDALSAAVIFEEQLWVASDELTSVERLTLNSAGDTFGEQRSFDLHEFIDLPATGQTKPNGKPLDQEIDTEGLDCDAEYLWLVGSHSIKRKKIDKDDDDKPADELMEKLSKMDGEGNRHILARMPLERNSQTAEVELRQASSDGARKAGQLLCTTGGSLLTINIGGNGGLKPDKHLAQFLDTPGKDNGFDIEGLAVAGHRVFIGLRGPVLRGWAIVLEVQPDESEAELGLKEIGSKGRLYRKHFLNLGGLGVREMCKDGSDLLVLAGPTMNLDGPTIIYRWKGALDQENESVVLDLGKGQPIPNGQGTDHAEGMVLLDTEVSKSVLIVYDNPGARKVDNQSVRADVVRLEV